MRKFFSANDPVLPRPIEKLPDYAHAKSRRALAERLVAAFGMSEAAADAISNAVVDPSAVRDAIGDPNKDFRWVEEISVPGGTLQGIRTMVWSRRVMPDPRNPRIGPSRRHPFAVDPGAGGEDSRFRPVPEPRSPEGKPPTVPEVVVEIESRHHLGMGVGPGCELCTGRERLARFHPLPRRDGSRVAGRHDLPACRRISSRYRRQHSRRLIPDNGHPQHPGYPIFGCAI